MNIYKEITKWIKENYPGVQGWVHFNAERVEENNASVMTKDTGETVVEFINGDKEITMPFTFGLVKKYNFEQSDLNAENMQEAAEFIEWLEEQEEQRNYPELGEKYIVEELSVVTAIPQLLVSTTEPLAKYVIECNIKYIKEQ